jgi:hypothetical protein
MQNTTEQHNTETRSQGTGTEINIVHTNSKSSFLIFMLGGFIFMLGIVFAGLYIDEITAVMLEKPAPPPTTVAAQPNKASVSLDSVAASMTVADDKALDIREGLTLWLKADALANMKDSTVAVLPDAAGKSNHAKQPVPGSQPSYIANGINGKPVLRFDGTDDYYFFGDLAGDSTATTIFMVWGKPTDGGAPYQRVYSSSANNIDYLSHGAVFIPQTANNGVGATPMQINIDVKPAADLRNFYIGRLNASPEQFFFGDLAEILVYTRALSVKEQQSVKEYLQKKYSL